MSKKINSVGFKKCLYGHKEVIVMLEILGEVRQAEAFNLLKKARTNKALVMGIFEMTKYPPRLGRKLSKKISVRSFYNGFFTYKEGDIVTPDEWDRSHGVCTNGIHFFYNLDTAIRYAY